MQLDDLLFLAKSHPLLLAGGSVLLVLALVASSKLRGLLGQAFWLAAIILALIVGYRLFSGGHITPNSQRFEESDESKSSQNPGHLYYRDPMAGHEGEQGGK